MHEDGAGGDEVREDEDENEDNDDDDDDEKAKDEPEIRQGPVAMSRDHGLKAREWELK